MAANSPTTEEAVEKHDPKAEKKMLTPVLNNTERKISIQLQGKKGAGGDIQPGTRIDLIPGINFVPTAQWNAAKQNEGCAILLRDKITANKAPEQSPERVGKLVLEERAPVSKDNPLAGMSEGVAVELVDEMFSVPMMKKFLDEEQRGPIRTALKAQIHKIENPPVKRQI